MKIGVAFSALAPPLDKQIMRHIPGLDHFQLDADAVTRLSIRGILSDSETKNARKRIVKAMLKAATSGDKG